MEWAMSFLQPLLLRDSSGDRKTSNPVNYFVFLGLCWSPLLYFALDTSLWACITSGRRGPSSQASRNINSTIEKTYLIFYKISIQDTNKPVKDTLFPSVTICTEGINMDAIIEVMESLIQCTPPDYRSRLWLKTSTSGLRRWRKCQPAMMATPLIFTSIKTI